MRPRTLSLRSFAPGQSFMHASRRALAAASRLSFTAASRLGSLITAVFALLLTLGTLPLPLLDSAGTTRFSCSCDVQMPCCVGQRCALGPPGHRGAHPAPSSQPSAPVPTLHSCQGGGETARLSPTPSLPALPRSPFRMAVVTVSSLLLSPPETAPARSAGDVEVPPPRALAA